MAQQVWGAAGLDDAVARRQDRFVPAVADNPGTTEVDEPRPAVPIDGTPEAAWWYLTDPQGSVVGLIDSLAKVAERVSYDPYGQATTRSE